jgi:predicted nucleotide-binding protein
MKAGFYPIEVINFGDPLDETHRDVMEHLNGLQHDFLFLEPDEPFRDWATPFQRTSYKTTYVWTKLEQYRRVSKGFRPFIIAIVHGKLSSEETGNLFGSRDPENGLAVVTTADWSEVFAPPTVSVLLTYYFINYAIRFLCKVMNSHPETRGCIFDFKEYKDDIKLSMKSGAICDQCRDVVEEAIGAKTYQSLLKMLGHLRKEFDLQTSGVAMPAVKKKPKVFIGSSTEGLTIAELIQLNLQHNADVDLWSQGVFGLSMGSLESLVAAVKKYDYAILVLTPDDLIEKRGTSSNSPRDNVLFELGLFMGRLGRDRTFMVYCRDKPMSLPSDLAGVTAATFADRQDGNLQSALGPVCTQVKQAMGLI